MFPDQRLVLQVNACAVTCGRSFATLGVWGVLIGSWSVIVFSPTCDAGVYLMYLLIYLFTFLSTELSGSSVTGAW